jgi:hypothetical protein
MQLKKHVKSTCYLNNMHFSYTKGHMSILYGLYEISYKPVCKKFLSIIKGAKFNLINWLYDNLDVLIFSQRKKLY